MATGTKPKKIDIKNIDKSKIFYEIYDLIPNLKEKNCCTIIGGGDAAFDYALNLSKRNIKSKIHFRSKFPKCLPLLFRRAQKDKNIEIFSSSIEYESDNSDFYLVACGRDPNMPQSDIDLEKSNIPGLYFAGDVQTGQFRQTSIAIGQGVLAAMKADEYLRGLTK